MKQIPETENVLVLRADFSDGAAWDAVCESVKAPQGDFQANVDCVSNTAFRGLDASSIFTALPKDDNHTMIFVVDSVTLKQPDHPVLCIHLMDQPGRTVRVIPSEMWSIENNLSLANMDFSDFVDSVGRDGVFRGFPAN
jgi:hypothetical protein